MRFSHRDGPTCPLCEYKAKDAHPYLRHWFRRKKQAYPNLHISEAWRDKDRQNLLFKQGKTLVKWPNGKHNTVSITGAPESRALDLFQIDEDGVARFSAAFMTKLNEENEAEGLPIRWGGSFKTLKDRVHFELLDSVV
jgi:hypothetical protein